MQKPQIYASFCKSKKQFAILIDPDKVQPEELAQIAKTAEKSGVDYIFLGSSLLIKNRTKEYISIIKSHTQIPVVLFPGNHFQLTPEADALLFLSLLSGRNPEMLIGQQVLAAPVIKHSGIEPISTAYLLVDGGKPSSVSYMSNTAPIPHDKADIALCTALAAEMLGFKTIFLDAGSGAENPVSNNMIKILSQEIAIPIIVGGGIKTPLSAQEKAKAGADIIVIGNILEKQPKMITDFAHAIHKF